MPPRFVVPSDEEMLAVLRPILVDDQVRKIPYLDRDEPCQRALPDHWPDMPDKRARLAALRLRLRAG